MGDVGIEAGQRHEAQWRIRDLAVFAIQLAFDRRVEPTLRPVPIDDALRKFVASAGKREFGSVAVVDGRRVREELEDRLRSQLEIKILVELVAPGVTDQATGKGAVGKLRRIRDDRV